MVGGPEAGPPAVRPSEKDVMPFQVGGASGSDEPPASVPVQGDEPPGAEIELREGVGEEEVPVVCMKAPDAPTPEEIARHNVTHIPYRAWCRSCVLARGRSTAHKKMIAEKTIHLLDDGSTC